MKKKILIGLIFLSIFSCGLNNQKGNDKNSGKNSTNQELNSTEQEVKKMVELWNKASSNGELTVLEDMLADKVEYYQSTVTKDEYIKDQKKFFEKNPVYGQVIKGDIKIQQISETQYKAEFVKEVTTKKGTKDYPSYLIFKKIGNEWKLILETDTVSDANIEKKKQKSTTETSVNNNSNEKWETGTISSDSYCLGGSPVKNQSNDSNSVKVTRHWKICRINGKKYRNILVTTYDNGSYENYQDYVNNNTVESFSSSPSYKLALIERHFYINGYTNLQNIENMSYRQEDLDYYNNN